MLSPYSLLIKCRVFNLVLKFLIENLIKGISTQSSVQEDKCMALDMVRPFIPSWPGAKGCPIYYSIYPVGGYALMSCFFTCNRNFALPTFWLPNPPVYSLLNCLSDTLRRQKVSLPSSATSLPLSPVISNQVGSWSITSGCNEYSCSSIGIFHISCNIVFYFNIMEFAIS